jgi:hypothetical protein
MCTHYFLYATPQIEAVPTDSLHHFACYWFALDELPSLYWPEQRALIERSRETIAEGFKRHLEQTPLNCNP